jgi:hypothetical protein
MRVSAGTSSHDQDTARGNKPEKIRQVENVAGENQAEADLGQDGAESDQTEEVATQERAELI